MAIGVENHSKVRERLLEAAGEVFAQAGYRGGTVREICGRSGLNVAAVNYYFGNKQQLYCSVLEHACQSAFAERVQDHNPSPKDPPAERLRVLIHSILLRLFDEKRPAWHDRVLGREMIEPTAALGGVVLQRIKPLHDQLSSIVTALLGAAASPDLVRRCTTSVIGQCMHLFHSRPLMMRLSPGVAYEPSDIERWADHIVKFSLAGIERIREEDEAAA